MAPYELLEKIKQIKWCNKCKAYKAISEFGKKKGTKDSLQYYCTPCKVKESGESRRRKGIVSREAYQEVVKSRSEKFCPRCKQVKPLTEFYTNNALLDKKSKMCKVCNNFLYKRRIKSNKIQLIVLMGNKCKRCGVSPNEFWPIACFELHHRNPKEKESELRLNAMAYKDIVKEAKKCDLLCANCHEAVHYILGKGEQYDVEAYLVQASTWQNGNTTKTVGNYSL